MTDLGDAAAIGAACRSGQLDPRRLIAEVLQRVAESERPEAWIHRASAAEVEAQLVQIESLRSAGRELPLFGVPFAVKDNIDVAGMPTTAGCPAFAYVPEKDATAVAALRQAGAICVGKTHMDQFATGLVGTRSPHGPCRNAVDPQYIAGGSSSGSAVVVAQGLVSFALGTDTAGSGRVPAAMNGIIGLKPTRGLLSVRGVVPACLSLDCVSVFSASVATAGMVLRCLLTIPPDHFLCRRRKPSQPRLKRFRFGVPSVGELADLSPAVVELYERALARLSAIGGERVEIDYRPFLRTSSLLYEGPWVAERYAAVGEFLEAHPDDIDPVVGRIILGGRDVSGRQVFEGEYELARLKAATAATWTSVDLLALPTVTKLLKIDEVLGQPVTTNQALGRHHNFVNLLDLSACVVRAGRWPEGIPFGLTLVAPAFAEDCLLDLAARLEHEGPTAAIVDDTDRIRFVVVGAHLRGMPLSGDLLRSGGRFEAEVRTAPRYRLFALSGTQPAKPGLCRVENGGVTIAAEIWSLPADAFGSFVAAIPRPLGMGRLILDDGSELPGFICEPEGLTGATDISSFGGWRAYIEATRAVANKTP